MANFCDYEQNIELPVLFSLPAQKWIPTQKHPYPMNFVQAPSPKHQINVFYNGKPQLQGLSTVTGPIMYPLREVCANPKNGWERKHTIYPKQNSAIVYPTTHSIPGPFLQSYIALPNKMYPY